MRGLQRIHLHPELIATKKAIEALWILSDDDGTKPRDMIDDKCTVVRICEKGQKLETPDLKGFTRALHLDLTAEGSDAVSVDLSIYATPPGKTDKDLKVTKNSEKYDTTVISNVKKLGYYRHDTGRHSNDRFHVYVYFAMTKMDVLLFVVYAQDGHEMKDLEGHSLQGVLLKEKLLERWQTHDNVPLTCATFGQIVRPASGQGLNHNKISSQTRTLKRKPSNRTDDPDKRQRQCDGT